MPHNHAIYLDLSVSLVFITVASGAFDYRTSSVTVPCSSYLASQSSYLWGLDQAAIYSGPGPRSTVVDAWNSHFGRSPECRSYAKMIHDQYSQMSQGHKDASTSMWTFSECQGESSTAAYSWGNQTFPAQVSYGLVPIPGPDERFCCGGCSLDGSEVRLYYFKEAKAT